MILMNKNITSNNDTVNISNNSMKGKLSKTFFYTHTQLPKYSIFMTIIQCSMGTVIVRIV